MASPPDEDSLPEMIIFSTLSILHLIKDAQQQHGLRHGDYMRYRGYCARRVRRVRKSLHFTHNHKGAVKAKKSANFQARKVVPQVVTDVKFLTIPLFDAERCWAYAMALRQDAEKERQENDRPSRKVFHMMNRLRKAIEHSATLESLCKTLPQVDPATKLEAQAYHTWMMGYLQFELKNFAQAKDHFTASQAIYDKLSGVVSETTLKQLYKTRCTEMVPQIRICAYELGERNVDIEELVRTRLEIKDDTLSMELDKLIAETRVRQAGQGNAQVLWCGRTVQMHKPSKVAGLHTTIQALHKSVHDAHNYDDKMDLYEQLLSECRDVVQSLRDASKAAQPPKDFDGVKIGLLQNYITYVRLTNTIDRYSLMINNSRKKKAQDLVRLYDNILQCIEDIEELSEVNDDPQLNTQLKIVQHAFKAKRCAHLAEAYSSIKKWGESLSLFDRAISRAQETKTMMNQFASPVMFVTLEDMDELSVNVNTSKYSTHAKMIAQQQPAQDNAPVHYDKPLMEDLDTWRIWSLAEIAAGKINNPIIKLPPDLRAMPCKPLFFDLALNHVTFPDLSTKIDNTPSKKKQAGEPKPKEQTMTQGQSSNEEQGGIGSVVKGWFWGSKK